MSIICGGAFTLGGVIAESAIVNPNMVGFTSANTVNAKKVINDVKNNVGSRHICVCGNSTKEGWGSNGTAFGVPATLNGASLRSLGQVKKWADTLASTYSIPVSSDNVWGGGGWTTAANLVASDPRLAATGSATISGTLFGPGGGTLTTTNATDTWAFTPTAQFDRVTVFYAGIGSSFSVIGDVGGAAQNSPSTAGSGNNDQSTTFTWAALQNTVTFQGLAAGGLRIYGFYTWKSTDPATLYVQNMGWGNSTSAQWANAVQSTSPSRIINILAPSLILFSEGINDPNTGVATATHNTNIATFINAVKKAAQDVIVYDDHWTASSDVDGAAGHGTLANITAALAGNKANANSIGIPYIDSPNFYTSYANQKNVLNYMYDVSHMLGAGHINQGTVLLMQAVTAWMAA